MLFYLDVSKDLLYIETPDDGQRRSVQTVIFRLLDALVRILAPIMSFTTEEVWGYMVFEGKEPSVHMSDWPRINEDVDIWKDEDLDP